MSKKLIYLISFIFVLGPASTCYGIQLGDFENSMDGWVLADPNNPNIQISYSDTNGVTLGSYSLRIDANSGWNQAIMYNLIDQNMVDEFRKNLKISLDVTRLAPEWTGIGWGSQLLLYISAGSSSGTPWSLWWQDLTQFAGWSPGDGNEPMSVTYDYSLALNQIDFNNLEYLQIIFCTNWGGDKPGGVYYLDNVQMFGGGPAYAPNPANGAVDVRTEAILSWTPGVYAKKHDVYLGTDFNDVSDANRTNPLGVLVSENQDANTYDPPGFLKSGKTYYWRVDEVNEPNIWKGDVWSFKTVYLGVGFVIGDWEKTMDGWSTTDVNISTSFSTTGVTLNDYSLKLSNVPFENDGWWSDMMATSITLRGLVDKLMSNDIFSIDVTRLTSEWKIDPNIGWAWNDLILILNAEGCGYYNVGTAGAWNQTDNPQTVTWDYSAAKALIPANPSYADFILIARFGNYLAGSRGTYYFDNAKLFDSRVASNPSPPDRAIDVRTEPTLSWKPGKDAKKHDVYFGTDYDIVNDANRTNDPCGVLVKQDHDTNNIYIAGEVGTLAFDTIYYWRIDEVNGPSISKGPVWAFMTGHYLIVDDFESYSLNPDLTNVWKAGGKATVGLSMAPVHEGTKAMAIDYNNTSLPYYSEAYANTTGPNSLNLDFGTNWLAEGVKALSLWLRGYPDVRGSFSYTGTDPNNLYTVKIRGSGGDIWGTSDQFRYAYRKLTDVGSITARVDSVENTNAWAKAGLMFRNTLDPDSKYVDVVVTPGNGVSFQCREETGGNSVEVNTVAGVTAPHWVKLYRWYDGSEFYIRAYHANDVSGSPQLPWMQIGDDVPTSLSDGWDYELYIGLCVTSHNANVVCDANLSNVTVGDLDPDYSTITDNWESKDINIPYNAKEPIYVMLQDNDSNATWYYRDDPNSGTYDSNYADVNVTQISTWTEWRMDLNDFRVKGVDLSKVQRIYIGIGDGAPGSGSGTMYFDDIRLYQPEFIAGKLPKIPADLVYDGVINYGDLGVVADNWLQVPTDPNINLYGGSTIDFRDFAEFGQYWYERQVWPTW